MIRIEKAVAMFAVFFAFCATACNQKNEIPAGSTRVATSGEFVGFKQKSDYQKLVSIAVSKDPVAFEKMIDDGLAAGNAIRFNQGDSLTIVEAEVLSGLIKVRKQTDTAEYWTSKEVIE